MSGVHLMLLLVPGAEEVSDAEVLARAEAAFRAGVELRADSARAKPHFQQAVRELETLQARGVANPAFFLQLGNARLLSDDLAGAVLAYHQGLTLAPTDRDLRAALDHARTQVAYPAGGFARPPEDHLPPWLPRPGPTPFLLLVVGAFTLACIALTRGRMLASRRWLLLGLLTLVLSVCGGVVIYLREQAARSERALVVIAVEDVLLRRGDGLSFPPRYPTPLPRGTEARLRRERGDWLQIELTGGEIGWVPGGLVRR